MGKVRCLILSDNDENMCVISLEGRVRRGTKKKRVVSSTFGHPVSFRILHKGVTL